MRSSARSFTKPKIMINTINTNKYDKFPLSDKGTDLVRYAEMKRSFNFLPHAHLHFRTHKNWQAESVLKVIII